MALTFPLTSNGLEVDVLVNLEAAALLPLWQAGMRPPPVPGRGLIDTGSDVTGVSQSILQQLGAPVIANATTHGIGGSVTVRLYRVSLHVFDARDPKLPWIPHPTLDVMELSANVPFDVLIGLDVLLAGKLFLDGPGGRFTMES